MVRLVWAVRASGTVKGKKRIEVIADKCSKMAEEGDMAAIREIGDRLDGKSAQEIELGGRDGKDLSFTITFVKPDGG